MPHDIFISYSRRNLDAVWACVRTWPVRVWFWLRKQVPEEAQWIGRVFSRRGFDKQVAQSTRGQLHLMAWAALLMLLAGAVVGICILGKDDSGTAKFGYRGTWGVMQCVDGGFVDATISSNTKTEKSPDGTERIVEHASLGVVGISLLFWLSGMVLVSFFTGAAANFLDARREKILKGDVDYSFEKDYVLIVGYDFQVKNLVRNLLEEDVARDIVLLTDSSVEDIYGELFSELSPAHRRRFFAMRKDLTTVETYSRFMIAGAEQIYLIGDGGASGRDGKTLRALKILEDKARSELPALDLADDERVARAFPDVVLRVEPTVADAAPGAAVGGRQVKVYLHIDDSALYVQIRAMKLPGDKDENSTAPAVFDLEPYNYYESWAWECWSHKGAGDGADAYLPIKHVPGDGDVELFVIGAGRMGRAMVGFAMPLMNYGRDGRHSRITVFDPDPHGCRKSFLPDRAVLDALPEVEVVFRSMDACSDEANAIMLEAAEKPGASVTVVVALSDPGAAVRVCSELSGRLRRKNVSLLVWQATRSGNCPDKDFLRLGGPGTEADGTSLRYFGMTDRLPWRDAARSKCGMAFNYFYKLWYAGDGPPVESPVATADGFLPAAVSAWNPERAAEYWGKTDRWKKWSSVNGGDSFREKAVLLRDAPWAEAAERVLRAEHDRWWTERLLAGWIPDPTARPGVESHADKSHLIHGDMVPCEELNPSVKDKDKICIAAMAVCGYWEAP